MPMTYKELVTRAEGEVRSDGVVGYFSGEDDAGRPYSIAVYDSGRIQIEIRGQPILREAAHWWRLADSEAGLGVPVVRDEDPVSALIKERDDYV